jgi:uncharacterized DUF497 family protein
MSGCGAGWQRWQSAKTARANDPRLDAARFVELEEEDGEEKIRIISARKADPHERTVYDSID